MKLAYSIDEAADILSVGRTKIYEYLKSGDLKARKFGRRTLILKKDLEDFLVSLQSY